MSQFRAKKLDISCFVNARILRDHTKRKVFEQHETERYLPPSPESSQALSPIESCAIFERWANSLRRQALRYIIRNTTLPPRVRVEAQLQLTQMHSYTRPTQIKNRCVMGGKGRGILRAFKLSRVKCLRIFLREAIVDGLAV